MNTIYFILGLIVLIALDIEFHDRVWKPYTLGYGSAFIAGGVFTVLVTILTHLTD